jgi:hypothetical protein
VDISTNEGFEKLQSELRKYAANPRSNAAARTRISEVLAAGDEAAAPLAAMEAQVAAERAPTPQDPTYMVLETQPDGRDEVVRKRKEELTDEQKQEMIDRGVVDASEFAITPEVAPKKSLKSNQHLHLLKSKRSHRKNCPHL